MSTPIERAAEPLWFDRGTAEEPPPGLYRAVSEAAGIDGFAALTGDSLAFFEEQGYLAIHGAFTPTEVESALAALLELIAEDRPGLKGLQFEAQSRDLVSAQPRAQRQDLIRKVDAIPENDPRLEAFVKHPRLIALLSRMFGTTPELLHTQALLKPPEIGREKPWHQDHSMFDFALDTQFLGAWVALDEATPENGCMHVIPGSHRQGPVVHFPRRDFQICDTEVATDRVVAVPLQPGGLLLFHNLLHHATPPNRSARRRRAMQFWYARPGYRRLSAQERQSVWGSAGKDVAC